MLTMCQLSQHHTDEMEHNGLLHGFLSSTLKITDTNRALKEFDLLLTNLVFYFLFSVINLNDKSSPLLTGGIAPTIKTHRMCKSYDEAERRNNSSRNG